MLPKAFFGFLCHKGIPMARVPFAVYQNHPRQLLSSWWAAGPYWHTGLFLLGYRTWRFPLLKFIRSLSAHLSSPLNERKHKHQPLLPGTRWLFQWSYVKTLSSGAEQFYVHWPIIKCLNPELNFIPWLLKLHWIWKTKTNHRLEVLEVWTFTITPA